MVQTRIACVSDTHGYSPADAAFKLPKGDVLIHAGDLTRRGTLAELKKTVKWIEDADFEEKIVISDIQTCIDLLATNPHITYLNHETTTIRLTHPNGPRTMFKVFGSPYIPDGDSNCKLRAFSYAPNEVESASIWSNIPLDTDIVVTHTPALSHRDYLAERGENLGCEKLRRALGRVRPRLAVCGHVHESRGAERVRWDLSVEGQGKEVSALEWMFPPRGSKKQCLVAFAGGKGMVLDNDGWKDDVASNSSSEGGSGEGTLESVSTSSQQSFDGSRKGRNETCFVNACILANVFPYAGGKKFNAPIMVDLDLPLNDQVAN